MSEVPGSAPVREEDRFDVASVRSWLAGRGVELAGDVEVRQFGGGASNLTYSLRDAHHDLILRRPPSGHKAKGAHDMGREYRIQDGLAGIFALVPEMVALCEDESVIGLPFYLMQRIDGIIPGRDFPPGSQPDRAQARALCTNALDRLIELHSIEVSATPLARMSKGHGYVARQVAGWTKRFRDARTDDFGADRIARDEEVMAWLDEHQPDDVASCLIHNDYRFDNLVLDRADVSRPVGVLDWEMATVGDPLMELGGTLSYWVRDDDDEFFRQFRRQPTHLPGMLSREEVVDYYCGRMGYSLSAAQWRFYEVFGLFRLAVIAQQIYYRYFHGQTTNEDYAIFGPATEYLEARCLRLIGAGS